MSERKPTIIWLDQELDDRARTLAVYIIETGATVRAAAEVFGVSKSTVHKDIAERLRYIDPSLYAQAEGVLALNKAERHLRGGEATRRRYLGE